jgi:hypothetical protein
VRPGGVHRELLGLPVGAAGEPYNEALQRGIVDVAERSVRIRDRDRSATLGERGAEVGSPCSGAVVRVEVDPGRVIDGKYGDRAECRLALAGTIAGDHLDRPLARSRVL